MKKEPTLDALLDELIEKKIEEKLKTRLATDTPDGNMWQSPGQAAKEKGCSRFAIEKAIANGEIDFYRPEGGRTYVKRKDVDAWIESVRIRANSSANEYEFLNHNK